ncbi:MAG: hypothetical protein KF861_16435 [Planctomycetaceae bacterium]|nr:hypothetical protein [Planctomycetaceae bacterium]
MPQFIGMDEAGYGPNLGPLVIAASAWDVHESPQTCNLWHQLQDAVVEHPEARDERLHIADSKRVFSTSRGLAALETSALCLLRWAGYDVSSYQQLWSQLAVVRPLRAEQEPWFVEDVALPVAADPSRLEECAERLVCCAIAQGVPAPRMRCDVVLTERFNQLSGKYGSKGRTLSSLSLSLLSQVWARETEDGCWIIADKHGGRNRYDELLADILDGEMIFRIEEGRECSIYRVGQAEIRFQTKAEAHFPVAVASLIAKYLREVAMCAFNRYWRQHVPGLRPTQGYPQDARRFRAEIAEHQAALNIPDHVLWRER